MSQLNLEDYLERVRAKVSRGAVERGDRSFDLTAPNLIEELRDETADISGWGALLDRRLQILEQACAELEELVELRQVAERAVREFRVQAEERGAPPGTAALRVVSSLREQLVRMGCDVSPREGHEAW